MTAGRCARCGAEDSMFWYPYAFGIAPIPDGRPLVDCQRYMLCDKCQTEFIRFMNMKPSGYYIKKDVKDEDINYIREVMDQ